jgi:hypothetical protein
MSEPEPEPVETTDGDEAEVMLADPDDYHQAQRLREIHKARREVHNVFTDIDTYTDENTHNNQRGRLAHAVTAYLVELQPIFRQADVDTSLPNKAGWPNFQSFITATGYKPGLDEYASYQAAMSVFEIANQRFAEVKPLVEPDETDEWEIET